jgi:hypothetical protein
MPINQNSVILYRNLFIAFIAFCLIGFPLAIFFGADTIKSQILFFNVASYYFAFATGAIISLMTVPYFGLRSRLGKTFFWLGAGLFSINMGLIIWDFYELGLKVDVPYPSIADTFYLLLSPCVAIALYHLISIYQISVDFKKLILPFITLLSWIFIVGYFNESPIWSIFSDQSLSTVTNALYLLTDGLTASMATLFLTLSQGKLVPFFKTFGIGFLLYTIGNAMFIYEVNTETYFTGNWSDRVYIISGVIMTYAIVKIRSEFIDKQTQE